MASTTSNAANLLLRDKDGALLPLHPVTLIGREEDCQIVLADSNISRYHARLTVKNASFVLVEDLNSTNGTFVNGQRVRAPRTMTIGDELRLHESSWRLTSAEARDVDATRIANRARRATDNVITASAQNPSAPAAPVSAATPPPSDPDATYLLSANDLARLREAPRGAINVQRPGEAVTGPCLVVLSAPIRGKVIPLKADGILGQWIIGRSKEAHLELVDRSVSREHARIRKQGTRWLIENIQASNKVYVNGAAIESVELKPGDRILLGRTEIEFKISHDSTAKLPEAKVAAPSSKAKAALFVIGALIIACVGILLFHYS